MIRDFRYVILIFFLKFNILVLFWILVIMYYRKSVAFTGTEEARLRTITDSCVTGKRK